MPLPFSCCRSGHAGTSKESTVSLKEFLNTPHHEYLFDMTARHHGKSTSQEGKKRPTIFGKRPREEPESHGDGNDDDDAFHGVKTAKKTKCETERNFTMTKWETSDFLAFLQKADVEFDNIRVQTDTDDAICHLQNLKRSMIGLRISNEEALQHEIECRICDLSRMLSSDGTTGKSFLGRTSMAEQPACAGTDKQMDFVYLNDRNRQNPQTTLRDTGLVPWEVKVSWNFPGASSRADYGGLGQDIKLHDLLPSRPTVDSLAHAKKDIRSKGHEGEDLDENAMTKLQAPDIAVAESREANSHEPNHGHSTVDGNYTMHHDDFLVRQIVSYMLSYKARYGILSTGYRFDFIKLQIVGPNRTLQVQIAGPLWAVGKLNYFAVKNNNNESAFYKSIHRYGTEDPVSILDETWSTKIGEYPFMEGLVRFFLAATGMDTQQQGTGGDDARNVRSPRRGHRPRSHMTTMPWWCDNFSKSAQRRRPNPNDVKDENYDMLCKGNQLFLFKDDNEMKEYVSIMKEEKDCDWSEAANDPEWGKGLTKFGPLTLAELESSNKLIHIGSGRIGEALRVKLPDINIACKLLRRSEWGDKPYEKRVQELKDEMETYCKLRECQGVCIPRFLFAGHITEASYWIIPEHGEMIAFGTTYEGISLTEENVDNKNLGLNKAAREQALQDVKTIHEKGIVHCDLVSRNLVYDEASNRIKFIDFGSALSKSSFESADSSWQEYCNKDIAMLENVLSNIPYPPKRSVQVPEQGEKTPSECSPSKTTYQPSQNLCPGK